MLKKMKNNRNRMKNDNKNKFNKSTKQIRTSNLDNNKQGNDDIQKCKVIFQNKIKQIDYKNDKKNIKHNNNFNSKKIPIFPNKMYINKSPQEHRRRFNSIKNDDIICRLNVTEINDKTKKSPQFEITKGQSILIKNKDISTKDYYKNFLASCEQKEKDKGIRIMEINLEELDVPLETSKRIHTEQSTVRDEDLKLIKKEASTTKKIPQNKATTIKKKDEKKKLDKNYSYNTINKLSNKKFSTIIHDRKNKIFSTKQLPIQEFANKTPSHNLNQEKKEQKYIVGIIINNLQTPKANTKNNIKDIGFNFNGKSEKIEKIFKNERNDFSFGINKMFTYQNHNFIENKSSKNRIEPLKELYSNSSKKMTILHQNYNVKKVIRKQLKLDLDNSNERQILNKIKETSPSVRKSLYSNLTFLSTKIINRHYRISRLNEKLNTSNQNSKKLGINTSFNGRFNKSKDMNQRYMNKGFSSTKKLNEIKKKYKFEPQTKEKKNYLKEKNINYIEESKTVNKILNSSKSLNFDYLVSFEKNNLSEKDDKKKEVKENEESEPFDNESINNKSFILNLNNIIPIHNSEYVESIIKTSLLNEN